IPHRRSLPVDAHAAWVLDFRAVWRKLDRTDRRLALDLAGGYSLEEAARRRQVPLSYVVRLRRRLWVAWTLACSPPPRESPLLRPPSPPEGDTFLPTPPPVAAPRRSLRSTPGWSAGGNEITTSPASGPKVPTFPGRTRAARTGSGRSRKSGNQKKSAPQRG